jgi:hypothetical protein
MDEKGLGDLVVCGQTMGGNRNFGRSSEAGAVGEFTAGTKAWVEAQIWG